jgi:signal transduction histidine kinase/GAF domain-containing protein/ActR/RegA family two-component response regulator
MTRASSDLPDPAPPVEKRAQLEELLELTKRLSEPLEAEEVACAVVDRARAAVGAMTAAMWTVDDPPTHATLLRASGLDKVVREHYARIPLEPWLPMGDAMLRCEPLFFESRDEFRERYSVAEQQADARGTFPALSYACLPLVAHGRAVGGVSLVFPHTRVFDRSERTFLTVLAHHAAQALERAGLFEREKRARRRLEGTQQVTSALSAAVTVEAVAKLATDAAVEVLGFAAAALWATDHRGDLHLLSERGMAAEDRETFRHIPIDTELPAARIARTGVPVWCESEQDVVSEPASVVAALRRDDNMRSYGGLPLARDGRVLGVFVFSAGRRQRFSAEDRALMTSVAAHCADALARARLHDEARSMERLVKRVLERLPVGIIVARLPDGTLVLSNDAAARIWRTDALPAAGEERFRMLSLSYPDGRPMPQSDCPMVRALNGEVVDGIEARIVRRDGTHGWIQVSAAPVLRDDGTVEVGVAAVGDITALKEARTVAEEARTVAEEARTVAEEAGRAKDDFLAMLGHELRNPLQPIVTALKLMDLRGDEVFRAERAMIARQVRHVVRLVDDLLDVSRFTSGKLLLETERIEVARAIASAIESASPLFEQRSQQVTVSVPENGLPVLVDPARLSQAVANLLTNAAKYTEPRGHITVTAAGEAGQVCIRVRDTGIGIDPGVLPTVFDLFVQAKRSIDRSQGGLGLGLTIVRKLVELQGGSVSAHSAGIGSGSEFVIRLPLASGAEPESLARPRSSRVEGARARPWRVLVVDDNEDIADGLSATLQALGCVTRVAYDGPSAIAAAEDFDADLALLDIGLPVMDGYEVARRLRQIPGTRAMRLVALTGYGRSSDKQKALEAGFDQHIAKPVEFDTIRDLLVRLEPTSAAG